MMFGSPGAYTPLLPRGYTPPINPDGMPPLLGGGGNPIAQALSMSARKVSPAPIAGTMPLPSFLADGPGTAPTMPDPSMTNTAPLLAPRASVAPMGQRNRTQDVLERLSAIAFNLGGNAQPLQWLNQRDEQRRNQMLGDQRQQALWTREDQQRLAEEQAKRNAPQYFESGKDRVRYDPTTRKSEVVYNAPEDYEAYATALGFQPGSPEYQNAERDYVLKGYGPSAFGFKGDLQEQQFDNRAAIKGMPTYRESNPLPRGGGGGGRRGSGGGGRGMAGVMAPILAKVAAGQPLTPGETTAWGMYRGGGSRGAVKTLGGFGRSKTGGVTGGGGGSGTVYTDANGRRIRWNGTSWEQAK